MQNYLLVYERHFAELREVSPRRVRFRNFKESWKQWLFYTLTAVMWVYLSFRYTWETLPYVEGRWGYPAQGILEDKDWNQDVMSDLQLSFCHLQIQYYDRDHVFQTGTATTNWGYYSVIRRMEQIPIHYLPGLNGDLYLDDAPRTLRGLLDALSFDFIVFVVLPFFVWWRLWRIARLIREGPTVQGMVTEEKRFGLKNTTITFGYNGQTYRIPLKNWSLEAGNSVIVIVDPENPSQSLVYSDKLILKGGGLGT